MTYNHARAFIKYHQHIRLLPSNRKVTLAITLLTRSQQCYNL